MAEQRRHGHPRGRGKPQIPQFDTTAADAERERKQQRKNKLRGDKRAKRRKGHN